MSTIEVPNDDEKNFGGAETKLNITKGEKPPKVNLKNYYFHLNIILCFAFYYFGKSNLLKLDFLSKHNYRCFQ